MEDIAYAHFERFCLKAEIGLTQFINFAMQYRVTQFSVNFVKESVFAVQRLFTFASMQFKTFFVNFMPIRVFVLIARVLPIGDWLEYEKQDAILGTTSFSKAIENKDFVLLDRILRVCSQEALNRYLMMKDCNGISPVMFHLTQGNDWFPNFSKILELLPDFYKSNFKNQAIKQSESPPLNNLSQKEKDFFLRRAVKNGKNIEYINKLIEAGADLQTKSNRFSNTPLLTAAHNGNADIVDFLIAKKAKLEYKDYYMRTALMKAAKQGHTEVVKILIKAGSNLEAVDGLERRTALFWAACQGHLTTLKALIDANTNTNLEAIDGSGDTLLTLSVKKGHTAVADFLIQQNNNLLEIRNQYGGYTPLMLAVEQNQISMVELLIRRGANFNVLNLNRRGAPLLIVAAEMGLTSIVQLLIEAGANLEAQNLKGWTALIAAASNGKIDVVNSLIKVNANIKAVTRSGQNALTKAAMNGYSDMVDLLIQNGNNVNHANKKGMTPLMLLSKEGRSSSVGHLIKAKADFEVIDHSGNTALSLAVNSHYYTTAYWLLSAMSTEQIATAIKANPDLNIILQNFEEIILEIQNSIFSLFGACIIKEDQGTYVLDQPRELIAMQLSKIFPKWYVTNRLENDMQLVFSIMYKMREKRRAEFQTINHEKELFNQLYSANPEIKLILIKQLGEKYTYQNCLKYLGHVYSARAFPSDAMASIHSYFVPLFKKQPKNGFEEKQCLEKETQDKNDIQHKKNNFYIKRHIVRLGLIKPF